MGRGGTGGSGTPLCSPRRGRRALGDEVSPLPPPRGCGGGDGSARIPGTGRRKGLGQGPGSLTHRPPPAPGRGSAPAAARAPRPAPAAAPPGGHRRRSPASHDTSSARQRHPVRRRLQRESRSASPVARGSAPVSRVAPAAPSPPALGHAPARPRSSAGRAPPHSPAALPAPAAATCGGPAASAGGHLRGCCLRRCGSAACRGRAGAHRHAHRHAETRTRRHGCPYLGGGQRGVAARTCPARPSAAAERSAAAGSPALRDRRRPAAARAAPPRRTRMAAAGTAAAALRGAARRGCPAGWQPERGAGGGEAGRTRGGLSLHCSGGAETLPRAEKREVKACGPRSFWSFSKGGSWWAALREHP